MPNIPLPKIPDVKTATGYTQVDPNTGAQPYIALQKAGAAIGTIGDTAFKIGERKRKQDGDAAMAALDLEMLRANGEIQDFSERNQDKPDKIRQFADNRYGQIPTNLQDYTQKLAPEDYERFNAKRIYQSERGIIGVNNETTKIEVENNNATLISAAKARVRAGDTDTALEYVNQTSLTDATKQDMLENMFKEGLYQSAEAELLTLDTVEEFEQFQEEIMDADKSGRYKKYEVTVRDQPLAGLEINQRKHLNNVAEKQKRRLQSDTQKNYNKMMQRAIEGERYDDLITPNMTDEELDYMESLYDESATGYSSNSAQYLTLSDQLATYLVDVAGGKELSSDKLNQMAERIFSDEFQRDAKVELAGLYFQAMSHNAMKGEVEYDSSKWNPFSWFNDRSLSESEQRALGEASARAEFFFSQKAEDPFGQPNRTLDSIGSGLYKVQQQILLDGDNGILTEENADEYLKNTLPVHINKFMGGATQSAIDRMLLDNG